VTAIFACACLQGVPEYQRAERLIKILITRDQKLVPAFYQALVETDQEHVARKLGYLCWYTLHCFLTYHVS